MKDYIKQRKICCQSAAAEKRNMPSLQNLLSAMVLCHFLLTDALSPNMTTSGSKLRIGMTGVLPNLYIDQNNVTKGSEMRALRILSEKMSFDYSISLLRSFDELVNKVGYNLVYSKVIQFNRFDK